LLQIKRRTEAAIKVEAFSQAHRLELTATMRARDSVRAWSSRNRRDRPSKRFGIRRGPIEGPFKRRFRIQNAGAMADLTEPA
jgi:hypothetical protein